MVIESLLAQRGMTKYKLAMQAGIPHPTLSDICSGKELNLKNALPKPFINCHRRLVFPWSS